MIKIILSIFFLIETSMASGLNCQKIYLDDYIVTKAIPLNKSIFNKNNESASLSTENLFTIKHYGMKDTEFKKIDNLHFYLATKDKDSLCADDRTYNNYFSFLLLESLHIYLVGEAIKLQNIYIAKKLFNKYDLIDGALAEGRVYEIVLPLLIHMKKSRLLFALNEDNLKIISDDILAWVEASNGGPYRDQNNPDSIRAIPIPYEEYRKNIMIYYTLSPIKKDEISPNRNIAYLEFLQILKSHNLNTLADKIDGLLKTMYLNSI